MAKATVILSPLAVAACPRCGQPIARGEPVEKFEGEGRRSKFAHVGCGMAVQAPAAPVRAAGRPDGFASDVEEVFYTGDAAEPIGDDMPFDLTASKDVPAVPATDDDADGRPVPVGFALDMADGGTGQGRPGDGDQPGEGGEPSNEPGDDVGGTDGSPGPAAEALGAGGGDGDGEPADAPGDAPGGSEAGSDDGGPAEGEGQPADAGQPADSQGDPAEEPPLPEPQDDPLPEPQDDPPPMEAPATPKPENRQQPQRIERPAPERPKEPPMPPPAPPKPAAKPNPAPRPQPSPDVLDPESDAFQEAVEKAAERVKDTIKAGVTKMVIDATTKAIPKVQEKAVEAASKAAQEGVAQLMDEARAQSSAMMADAKEQTKKFIGDALKDVQKQVHVIQRPDGSEELLGDEIFHEKFGEVLELVSAGFNVFLPGPTGSGKTHLGEQVARALGLDFAVVSGSAGTTEAEFFGRSYPNVATGESVYIRSEFVRLYENGGLFLLDEADAMDPNCFLKINSALANGFCNVPHRHEKPMAKRHERFVCVVAANTWGTGASRQYCGRNRLDEATLDRFRAGSVPIDYSPRIEAAMCPDRNLLAKLHHWRAKMTAANMQRILSSRFIRDAHKLKRMGKSDDYIAAKLAGGWGAKEAVDVFGTVPKG